MLKAIYEVLQFRKKLKLYFEVRPLILIFLIFVVASCKSDSKNPPNIKSINPTSGTILGGTLLSISGSDFTSGATVNIGNSTCDVVSVSSTLITCSTPALSSGTYNLVVTNPNRQSGGLASAYTYQAGPTVSSISPSSGLATGATPVTISGSNFFSGATVSLGGSSCNGVTVVNSSTITCTTTVHASGAVGVTVTNTDTQSGTAAGAYLYQGPPTITNVLLNAGSISGGTNITISGTGFATGASVSLGGAVCNSVIVLSPLSLTCTTSAHAAGTVSVTVTNSDLQTGTTANAYTYQPAPTISSVSPAGGALGGGTTLTITGTGFVAGAGVTINGKACIGVLVFSTTQLTCTTPMQLIIGAYDVIVTNADNQSATLANGYSYNLAPTVTSVNSNSGPTSGGTLVTVNGTGFLSGPTVTFGGTACTGVTVLSTTSLSCTTPAHIAGNIPVVVTNSDNQSGTLVSAFIFRAPPTVSFVTKNSGALAGGTAVTITGTGFYTGSIVTFGGSACTNSSVLSSSIITCLTPANVAGAVTVTVTNADAQFGSLANGYTYEPAPAVTMVSPASGFASGSTAVTITGTNFLSGAGVTIGGVSCVGAAVINSTTITCTTSAHSAGAADVTVTNSDTQSGTTAGAYLYQGQPTISNLSIRSGAIAGGTPITITGTGFYNGATVSFGGSSCSPVNVVNTTTMTCTTSAHAAGIVNVTVTNSDTQSGSLSSGYTYRLAPTVTSVSSNAGALGGGTGVTINGTGFYAGLTVDFGGSICTNPNVGSPLTITCTTAAHVAGIVNVTVTNADNQFGTANNAYTYQAAPNVSSVSPSVGYATGSTAVTLTGTGFLSGATVYFGGSACSGVTVVNSTTITCTTSAHLAGPVAVTVTNSDTQTGSTAAAFTYQAAPLISSISTPGGPLAGGTSVTLTGSGFQNGATVTFGSSNCTPVTVVSANTINCTTTAHVAGTVSVVVSNPDAQTGTMVNGFTYYNAPTVSSVNLNAGALGGGTFVTITGTGFLTGASVTFGGAACTGILVVNTTSITCTTPMKLVTGSVDVVVTNFDSQSATLTNGYTYNLAPTITSVAINAGSINGGTSVTITGTGFLNGATVTLGGASCTPVNVVSLTSITCTTTSHVSGIVTASVVNTDNQFGSKSNAYTYQVAPSIGSVSLNAGTIAGGNSITISGLGFLSGATVSIGGSTCTSVVVVNATTITCITPAHAAGVVDVTITNTDNQTGTSVGAYTFQPAPTITNVNSSAGPISGGMTVTITGTGFVNGATVNFGGSSCTLPLLISATSIQCTTPAHVAGTVSVVVTNADTQSGTLTNGYIYIAAPTVSSIALNAGALAGGTNVTIHGTNFISGALISLGGSSCSTNTLSSTLITCTTSGHAAGVVNLTITNPDGQSATLASSFTYQAAPTITSLTPTAGALNGGNSVTITGTGFLNGATVSMGAVACSPVTVVNATTLTCTTGSSTAGTVNVTVTNPDTQSATSNGAFTYQAAPTITSVSPATGFAVGGTAVTITGTGFISGATVSFGGASCGPVTIVSSTSLTCTTSAHTSGLVSATVTNLDNQAGTMAGAFTFIHAPNVNSVALNAGALTGGTAITISGTGFINGATVSIGGSACTVSTTSANSITCITQSHAAGVANVVVTNPDSQTGTLTNGFTYQAAPAVTSIALNAGSINGGNLVTITGTGFLSGASVTFGGLACTTPTVVSATSITCTVPAHAAGAVAVAVTNTDTQTGSTANAYTYQFSPGVSSITPTSGYAAGGTVVTITGSGFINGVTVSLGGSACTPVTFNSSTSISCTTTAHAAGAVNITVSNADTQNGTLVSGYTFNAPPTVTAISANVGSLNGLTPVTITGTGFYSGAGVTIGGSTCSNVSVTSATSLTCTTGAHAAGTVDVIVTNADTQSGTFTSGFTYQSMAVLAWQLGSSSPTPANPDSYGITSTNVTHTYTLKNTGDIPTTTISTSISGLSPAAWLFGTNVCAGITLVSNATCTVQVTFLGQYLSPASNFSATLNATAGTGGTTTNNMNGSTP